MVDAVNPVKKQGILIPITIVTKNDNDNALEIQLSNMGYCGYLSNKPMDNSQSNSKQFFWVNEPWFITA